MSILRANTIIDAAGTGAPTFSNGASITGVVTATSVSATTVSGTTIQVGSGTTIHTTGIDLGTGNIQTHNVTSTGTITGVTFVGSGAQLTNVGAATTAEAAQSLTGTPNIVVGVTTATTLNTNVFQSPAVAVGALSIDCSSGNYFTKTITSGTNTFTFDNVPTTGTAFSFTLELTHTGGTAAWPAAVKWPADTAPSLTDGKTSLFMFVTDDGGTRWRGNAIVDFTN